LKQIAYQPDAWIEPLRSVLRDGGSVAIICNTVDRAQAVYCAVQAAGLVEPEHLHLLHARMPFCWRNHKEKTVLSQFGKLDRPAEAPRRGIVVATQIIEQSLDLDFDLILSDLAPVDLVIQRVGRLHRHTDQAYPPSRPPQLSRPTCWICQPEAPDNEHLPVFGADKWVYEAATLQRTFFALQPLEVLNLPSMSDELINLVYGDVDLPAATATQNRLLQHSMRDMLRDRELEVSKAENRLVGDVDRTNLTATQTAYLKEDDPTVGKETQALTRNSVLPGVALVCFVRQDDHIVLLDEQFPLALDAHPHGAAVNHALLSLVNVTKGKVVEYFSRLPRHTPWQNEPALRHAFPVVFDINKFTLPDGTTLILDSELGLVVVAGN
jgi:CRISPR-associated endonuclease/helicase Cas3